MCVTSLRYLQSLLASAVTLEVNLFREETEQALLNDPIPIYEQDVEGEPRIVYYGETNAGRLLAVIVTEHRDDGRVVTAYDLDAGQRIDYVRRRLQGEET